MEAASIVLLLCVLLSNGVLVQALGHQPSVDESRPHGSTILATRQSEFQPLNYRDLYQSAQCLLHRSNTAQTQLLCHSR